ncbi:MAG: HAD-IIIC family phosphatase [Acetatifactor sp.]|nr:HAD-IIIC family phosphatase [Acetatifactor sp.]
MRELEYPFDPEWMRKKKRKIKKQLLEELPKGAITKKIAILGGSTFDEVRDMLELFLLNYGIVPSFYSSEYNSFYEDGMFDNPELIEFAPDLIYIHTSFKNIDALPMPNDSGDTVQEKYESVINKFKGLWEHLLSKYSCPVIQNNFDYPFYRLLGNNDAVLIQGRVRFVRALNHEFADFALQHENFFINDINYQQAVYGIDKWSDPLYWNMYKYALAVPAIPAFSYNLASIIKAIYGRNKKALSLDLDNTLWGGVIGDDGPDNIEIGMETPTGQIYAEFQTYLKELMSMGVLLTVNSKNDESVAREGFERPDSVLKKDDFIGFKANWEPKDRNLAGVAQDINLTTDSFVFVDDNPAEREIVKTSLTGTAVPDIGNAEDYIRTLDRAAYFEVVRLSQDDLDRNAMYLANAKRQESEVQFKDYGEYLDSLLMEAEIKPFSSVYYSRIAQLTNKSNQFNLTTKRMSQSDIERIAEDDGYITLYGKLKDRFGDNGVVSVAYGKVCGDVLDIEMWLMSCRVLKRDMEKAMMDELIRICLLRGIHTLRGHYYPTAKNGMVKDFFAERGFEKVDEDEAGNTLWERKISFDEMAESRYIKVNP